MQVYRWQCVAVLAALTAVAGCGSQQRGAAPEPLMVANLSKAQAVAAAEDVLTEMQFTIEKADAELGYLKTRPLRGGQFFEIWRNDNASAYQSGQSNLHSIQRTAEVSVSEGPGGVVVECAVSVRRLSLPESDRTAISTTAGAFTTSTARLQELRVNPDQAERMEWIELTPDNALAARILERIRQRIARG
jgi:RES domain-containing protein